MLNTGSSADLSDFKNYFPMKNLSFVFALLL
ncbi:MAG: hypothetical protein ACI9XB_003541, partial [Gammaproteobacteria bacterium]